ncbi:hypothetical protein BN1723_012073 [Verticillium longisporum]|uniref:Phosphatidylethanolamine-binding protein n=2 Tax=Verticillium TaxID=1036719 RepID=A0A0G4LEU0_VERLO|nr:hypothetical protein BN1723_012073 [Verticillium longisporum]
MMTSSIHLMAPRLEKTIGCLLKRARNISSLDDRPFHHGPAFVVHPDPTITIVSSDCGPSPAELHAEYLRNDLFKECGRMPCLSWNCPASIKDEVREWLLIIEDLDAPWCRPIVHGLYAGIPAAKLSVEPEDFVVVDDEKCRLDGGFHFGRNSRKKVYTAPKPMLNHGLHRYSFQVVALSRQLDVTLLESRATRKAYSKAIQGLVLGWGVWTASCERRWE